MVYLKSALQMLYSNDWWEKGVSSTLLLEVMRGLMPKCRQQLFSVPRWVLVNCVIWICQAAPSTSQGLLMMLPYIQYSLHLYRETALSTQCLDSLLVGSMCFSGGWFPAAIVWWCMGRCLGFGHLSHCVLFSLMMWLCELCQVFNTGVWCYNGSVEEDCALETTLDGNRLSSVDKEMYSKCR